MDVVFTDYQLGLLYKLWRKRCFGKGHMLIDNLLKGFPSHSIKEIREALDELIHKGIVIKKPTRHGYAVYINLDFSEEIYKELRKKYPFLK